MTRLGCLSEKAPEEIPLSKSKTSRSLIDGAVTAVWATVKVPKDAKPGTYLGSVAIEAKGEKPVTVPLELKVLDWTLSDPQDYKTWVEFLQSPDTLAIEYKTPLWSDRHWELIARSFRLLSDSGSRVVYVPLIAETNLGNSESMVRWIKKGENQYDYDFSVMDKYLDAAEKNLGPLKIVVFYAWEVYMLQKEDFQGRGYHKEFMEKENRFSSSKGPVVTVLDKATGKTENAILPRFQEAASKGLWKPLFDQLRERLAKRGLDKKMMVGMMNDGCPSKEDVAFFAEAGSEHALGGRRSWRLHEGQFRLSGPGLLQYRSGAEPDGVEAARSAGLLQPRQRVGKLRARHVADHGRLRHHRRLARRRSSGWRFLEGLQGQEGPAIHARL